MNRAQSAAAHVLVVVANVIAGFVAVIPGVLVLAGIMNWIAWRSTRLSPIVLVGLAGASLAAPTGFLELLS